MAETALPCKHFEMESIMCKLEKLERRDFDAVWKLMEESFPVDERRGRSGQEAILAESRYSLYGTHTAGILTAFLAVWEFGNFSFIEHFAVKRDCRNGGLGAKLLGQLLSRVKVPVILEVELPGTDLAGRRIAFYERCGFVRNPYAYIQPALSAEGKAIPLGIMSYPGGISEAAFQAVRSVLYESVYHVSVSVSETGQ